MMDLSDKQTDNAGAGLLDAQEQSRDIRISILVVPWQGVMESGPQKRARAYEVGDF